jgi:formate dehydrogenase subunit gamma
MNSAIDRFDERARRWVGGHGRTVVYEDELLRHAAYTRFLHWMVAIFFILALFSGLSIFTPWPFRWFTPIFGGPAATRALHPWFSLVFVTFFALQMLNWLTPMAWSGDDRRWLGHLRAYVTNADKLEPEYVGFFNAGQKVWFWAIAVAALVFLVTGIIMWFPQPFGRIAVAVGYVLHDLAMLVMLVGFIVHIYEGTAAAAGTFRSMTRGTVSRAWAWTLHPAWYREATGRDPREDCERARQRMMERRRTE